jgi:hypothetical protein
LIYFSDLLLESPSSYTIVLSSINNPTETLTTDSLQINTYLDLAMTKQVDTLTTGLTLTFVQAVLTFNSLTVSSYVVDTAATFTFSLTTTGQYNSGGYIEVVVSSLYISLPTT